MKYIVLIVMVAALFGCQPAKKEVPAEKADTTAVASEDWKEMDDFHMIMAESFHPYKDSANLEPAINQASQLAEKAATWQGAPLPERVNNPTVQGKIDSLKTLTNTFAVTAKSGDKALISKELTTIHDLFHTIQEAWYKSIPGEDHEHKHQH